MFKLNKSTCKVLSICILFGYITLFCILKQIPDDKFHITFLDVGQGDSIFIKTPENHQILIDGGPNNVIIDKLSEVLSFFDKSIDLVVLTHPHSDHVEGLVEVLKRFEVENLLITGVYFDNSTYFEFLDEMDDRDVNFYIADSAEDFIFSDVYLDVLYPFDPVFGQSFSNLNNSSIVIKVIYHDKSILLTGDLEIEGENELIKYGEYLKSEIFKAGHHGSKTASSIDLLKKIQPDTVVIQCGEDNRFDHPHEETLENFSKLGIQNIFRNDLDGDVEFVF